MTVPDQTDAWKKSSFSQPDSNCVELNARLDSVRDSKCGDVLRLDKRMVAALVAAARKH